MYQAIKKDAGALVGFGIFSLIFSVVFRNKADVLFNVLFLSVSLVIYFLCLFFISHKKTRVVVWCVGMFLVGFPIFYISKQYDVEAHVQAIPASSTKAEESVYQQVTSKMKKVTPENFLSVLEGDRDLVLYVGRGTCPHCTNFIQKIQSVDVSSVYYLDTEEKTDALYAFANRYAVDSIPQLLLFQNQDVVERFNLQQEFTVEQIEEFITR